jgi:hypothetical protein
VTQLKAPSAAKALWRVGGWRGILRGMSDAFYVVRDAAGAIYGPANVGTLRQWIGEGRITKEMHIAVQGTNHFMQAGQMPELVGAFPSDFPSQPVTPQAATSIEATSTETTLTETTSPVTVATAATTPTSAAAENPANQLPAQNYYSQTGQPYQQGYVPYPQKSSGMAVAALVCGLLSFAVCPAAIVAIILGHMARAQIRREPDRYEGDGMALAGLVIGYIWGSILTAIFLLYVLIVILAVSGVIR